MDVFSMQSPAAYLLMSFAPLAHFHQVLQSNSPPPHHVIENLDIFPLGKLFGFIFFACSVTSLGGGKQTNHWLSSLSLLESRRGHCLHLLLVQYAYRLILLSFCSSLPFFWAIDAHSIPALRHHKKPVSTGETVLVVTFIADLMGTWRHFPPYVASDSTGVGSERREKVNPGLVISPLLGRVALSHCI